MVSTLEEKLERIRNSPKLQNQQQTHVVLNAVEDTLRDQKSEFTAAAYFAALFSLLTQYVSSSKGIVNKDVATAVVYLLDLITTDVPPPLLRSKFQQVLQNLATVLTLPDAEAPLLRPSIGCLESLLVVQDAQAWALPQSQISPRRAVAGLLTIAIDHRPKVRRRAQEALSKILKNPPPSPSLDHPAADMCAETALRMLKEGVETGKREKRQHSHKDSHPNAPGLIHTLQLIKAIAKASGGWPTRKIDSLCELLLGISKSSNEYLTMASFEVFEVMFSGMADEVSSAKLPHLLEILSDLQPSENDSQLLPPWIAVLSRGYDVSAQVMPEETFQTLPEIFNKIAHFMSSMSHNIRVSAADCLISFLVNCVPASVIVDPSVYDEKTLEKLSKAVTDLMSVKYQSAWMDAFRVLGAMFDTLHWRAADLLPQAVKVVGELRSNESFHGKKEADAVLAKAIRAMGPDAVLGILPLNLGSNPPGPGRVWLLPIMRDSVSNSRLTHFRSELVTLSEKMFQRVLDHGEAEKTMEVKVYETIVNQVWSTLPGYCDLPIDLQSAFDQSFAELLSNLLYQQVELRTDLCRALQRLVDSNKERISLSSDDPSLRLLRVSEDDARKNLRHLETFASNILAVLFNVYSQTLPQYRGPILQCINAYLGITPEKELTETFDRVAAMLESSLADTNGHGQGANKEKSKANQMPPMSQTLMDLVITISAYLPRSSLGQLFAIATIMLQNDDANLQKKAYKLIPRLADSEVGKAALKERSLELQNLLLGCSEKAASAARRDRISAITQIVKFLPDSDLHFIPSVLPEITLSTKETNEKARAMAFDLLVEMGEKMQQGGTIINSKVPHMPADSPDVAASLEEYLTMVSAGLAGTAPHSVSASITAVTRIVYQFRSRLSNDTIAELIQTMDIFLKSPNREIVRSVLGFVKASVVSLPRELVLPRLATLIPNLLNWSHEHKAQLQAKVKHIFERMVKRFGVEIVEKHTPESDRKLIANIRKTKARQKKRRNAAADGQDGEHGDDQQQQPAGARGKTGKFESEYDEALYGSEDESSNAGSDVSDDEIFGLHDRGGKRKGRTGQTYILEDDDEPLDLLDRRALANISSTRPPRRKAALPTTEKWKAKVDLDGKLILGGDDDDDDEAAAGGGGADTMMLDAMMPNSGSAVSLETGINAYVQAIRGRGAAKRGQRGKIKFSNNRRDAAAADDEEGDEMEIDGTGGDAMARAVGSARTRAHQQQRGGRMRGRGGRGGFGGGRGRGAGARGGGGGMRAAKMQRRGLGADKKRGGRVMKGGRDGGKRVGRY